MTRVPITSSSRGARSKSPLPSIIAETAQDGVAQPGELIGSLVCDTEQLNLQRRAKSSDAAALTPLPVFGHSSSTPAAPRLRADSSTLKRSHWQSPEKESRCFNQECRAQFSRKVKRRNCCMCGNVFCRRCTKFRRKLSQNAEPDPLGVYFKVCKACCDAQTKAPKTTDHSPEFNRHRMTYFWALNQHYEREVRSGQDTPLSARVDAGKKLAIRDRAELLAQGFEQHSGLVRDFVDGVRIPSWQKGRLWVPSGRAAHCFHCKKPFGLLSRKVHCHVCGQVCCCACTPDELLLYLDRLSGEAKWGVNGRDGAAPEVRPSRYQLLRLCGPCSSDLVEILREGLPANPATRIPTKRTASEAPPAATENIFMEKLVDLQAELASLQGNIEQWLPQYLHLVDLLDVGDSSPNEVRGRHPMKSLVLAQTNLSDSMSQLALQSQKLKLLRPTTETEAKLLRHVMMGTYQFYSENMYLFRTSKKHLAELTPVDHLEEIQGLINIQTMEVVHTAVYQLMFEVIHLHRKHQYDNSFDGGLVNLLSVIEEEFKALLQQWQMTWDEHMGRVSELVKSQMKNGERLIVISSAIEDKATIRYAVISTCSARLQCFIRQIDAKTTLMQFAKTKKCLKQVFCELDSELARHNATFPTS